MSGTAKVRIKYHRVAAVALVIAGVLGWPEQITWRCVAAILLFASLLFALFLVEISPWAYRWIWFGVVVPLSFIAPAAMGWSAGAEPSNIAATAGLLGTSFSAIAFYVAKRR